MRRRQGRALLCRQQSLPVAAKTRLSYSNDLADLLGFLGRNGKRRLLDLSQRDFEAYLAELDRRGYAGTSRKRRTYAIRTFFRFLYDSGYTSQDISHRLIPP
jgi:site-specific recombinase XerD